MKLGRLNHVGVATPSIERSVAHYRETMGAQVVRDPFDLPAIQLADKAMGVNGDLIVWAKANPIIITLNVIPDSVSDLALAVLAEQNRTARGKRSARDNITLTRIFAVDSVGQVRAPLVLTEGRLTDAPGGTGVASSGRKKTNAYTFAFERKSGF